MTAIILLPFTAILCVRVEGFFVCQSFAGPVAVVQSAIVAIDSQLTRSRDGQFLGRLSILGSERLQRLHDVHPLRHSTKDHVFAIEPRRLHLFFQ